MFLEENAFKISIEVINMFSDLCVIKIQNKKKKQTNRLMIIKQ